MADRGTLDQQFEQQRPHLRTVAYRMLGPAHETDDALQESWLRIRDQDPQGIENMQAWLTTIVGRVCLNMLRSRRSRREVFSETRVSDPRVRLTDHLDPEDEVLLANSVGHASSLLLAVHGSLATGLGGPRAIQRCGSIGRGFTPP